MTTPNEISPHMTLEDIQDYIGNKLEITSEKIDDEARKHPKLFNDIQRLHMWNTRKLEKEIANMDTVKHNRQLHYTGKMSAEHYKAEPLKIAILKTDVDVYIKADKVFIEQTNRLKEQERIVKYLEECKKQLTERGYLLKTIQDFTRMNMGM